PLTPPPPFPYTTLFRSVCQRWIGADDPKISVATYDLDNVAVLRSPAYLAIGGENLSPWSKRVTGRVERLMRFEGDQILPGDLLRSEEHTSELQSPDHLV